MSARPAVEIQGLRLGFRRPGGVHPVFRGADLAIREGEFACLIGPSGSGKTVLVNLLIGSLRPGRGDLLVEGRIAVFGTEVTRRYPRSLYDRLAVVFQESALFDDLSTFENVAFGLRRRRLSRRARRAEVDRLLRAVELLDPPGRTDALSGGQKKRLALARALAKDPDLLIFDEPTTGLDPRLRRQIAALIQRTHAAGGGRRTTLVVTHDYEDFLPLADRVLRIDTARGLVDEVPEGADPEAKAPRGPEGGAPRRLARERRASRILRLLAAPARGLLGWTSPILRLAASPLPSSLRQLAARLLDAVVHPALYTASAGAVLGGLSTFFALENNPLRGALDRQAIIGLGKVIIAIVVPLMTAVLFAARVGAGAAARLGNIRLRRGDDALRVLGADPDAYLTAPVFWAFLAGLPLLAVPVGIAAALASLAFACFSRPITPFGWAQAFFSEVTPGDLRFALLKLAGSGLLVAASAVYMGFKPKLGAEDLGRHVTGAIVAGTLLVILWHGLLTLVQYG